MVGLETAASLMGAGPRAHGIEQAALRYGILSPLAKAHFLAQMAVESADFTRVRESLNYSVEGLMETFGRHRISASDCARLGRIPGRPADQDAIANLVYGGPWGKLNLGNTSPNDGWWFIGRGLKQITGRDNYRMCSLALFGDERLLAAPELLELSPYSELSAGWYWQQRNLNAPAERDDLIEVTRRVNGGANAIEQRARRLHDAKRLLGIIA